MALIDVGFKSFSVDLGLSLIIMETPEELEFLKSTSERLHGSLIGNIIFVVLLEQEAAKDNNPEALMG